MAGSTHQADLESSSLSIPLCPSRTGSQAHVRIRNQCLHRQRLVPGKSTDQRSMNLQWPPFLTRFQNLKQRKPLKVSNKVVMWPPAFLNKFFPSSQIEDATLNHVPSSTNGVMNDVQRRNTSNTHHSSYSDPSAKIWNLYLSQAGKFDKDHSESWTANTDGVLVFVRQTFLINSSTAVLTANTFVRRVFSLR